MIEQSLSGNGWAGYALNTNVGQSQLRNGDPEKNRRSKRRPSTRWAVDGKDVAGRLTSCKTENSENTWRRSMFSSGREMVEDDDEDTERISITNISYVI